ncbi:MAG: S24 family peptidase [Pseudomonadota bacterium]
MNLGGRIKEAREHMKWSAVDLAEKSKVANTTIGALENRDSRRSEFAEALIGAFPPDKINHDYLRTGRGSLAPEFAPRVMSDSPEYVTTARMKRVPVVGTARMGEDGFYEEMSTEVGAGDGHIEIQTADPNAYCLRVRGNSMHPAIRDGWYVLIEPNATPAMGEYVLIKMRDGQRMVKELLYERNGSIEITSVNGDQRRTIYREDLIAIQAVGAVVSPSKWQPQ